MAEGERNEGTGTGFRGQQLLPSTRHKSISDPEKFETQDYFAMRGDGAPQHETGQRVATCCDELGACRSPDLPRSVTMLPPPLFFWETESHRFKSSKGHERARESAEEGAKSRLPVGRAGDLGCAWDRVTR